MSERKEFHKLTFTDDFMFKAVLSGRLDIAKRITELALRKR